MRKTRYLFTAVALFALAACAQSTPESETVVENTPPIAENAPPVVDNAPPAPENGYPVTGEQPAADTGASSYPAAEGDAPAEASTSEPYAAPEATAPTEPAAPSGAFSAEPQYHEFAAEDGVLIASTFYPPREANAPLVILYHQAGASRAGWEDMALWLQNRPDELGRTSGGVLGSITQYAFFPTLPAELSFAVLAIDFRNHGDSGNSSINFDRDGFLMDAQAALAYGKTLPGVNPNQIITMGASIGADAAVNVCVVIENGVVAADQVSQGCVGAISLSPGNYLDVDYAAAAAAMGQDPINAYVKCLASADDQLPAATCNSLNGEMLFSQMYPGNAHGMGLLLPDVAPDIGVLLMEALLEFLDWN